MDRSAERPGQPGFGQDNAWRALLPTDLQEVVSSALREAARTLVIPSFGGSGPTEVSRKASGTLVTRVDREVESRLTAIVATLLPHSRVIGEEAAAADPTLLTYLEHEWVWLIDPLDGRANFTEGRKPITMMVALLDRGAPVLAWILDPLEDVLLTAGRGEGFSAGRTAVAALPMGGLRGAAWTRYFDAGLRQAIERRF
jgi:fructose-1,6-bisphosphatase/inositol monophosphatase family enzyme